MYAKLIGQNYGMSPADHVEQIKKDKKDAAVRILQMLDFKKSDAKMLEIGSGCGYLSEHLAQEVAELHCVDVSASFLEEAKKNCQHISNIQFHLIQSAQFDFLADASLDAAVAYNVFIHFNLFDMYWHFAELQRVLKPGGFLVFDFANTKDFGKKMPSLFMEMTNLYKQSPEIANLLVQWHHPQAIVSMARHFGFEELDFERNPKGESVTGELIERFRRIILKIDDSPHKSVFHFRKKSKATKWSFTS